jgi:hypothetical protein
VEPSCWWLLMICHEFVNVAMSLVIIDAMTSFDLMTS